MTPNDLPIAPSQGPAVEDRSESGYLLANFLLGLACFAQVSLSVLGTIGIYGYLAASITGKNSEGYMGIVAPLALLPASVVILLAAGTVLLVANQKVSKPLRRSLWICSGLPVLALIVSLLVPLVFDGPPLF